MFLSIDVSREGVGRRIFRVEKNTMGNASKFRIASASEISPIRSALNNND